MDRPSAADEVDPPTKLLTAATQARLEKRFSDAEQLCTQALEIADQAKDSAQVRSEANNQWGLMQLDQQQPAAAIQYFRKALDGLAESHSEQRAVVNYNLGFACFCHADYGDSVKAFEAALEIRVFEYGNEDPRLINLLQNLADACAQANQHEKSIDCLRRILEIRRTSDGENSLQVAAANAALATQIELHQNAAAALPFHRESVRIYEALHGQWNVDVINGLLRLSKNLQADQQLEESLTVNRLALERAEKLKGPDSPDFRPILRHQLVLHQARSDAKQVEAITTRLNRLEAIAAWHQRRTAQVGLVNSGQLEQAISELPALQAEAATFGEISAPAAWLKYHEAALFAAGQRWTEAVDAAEAGLDIERRVLGDAHPEIAASWKLLADHQIAAGELALAQKSLVAGRQSNADSGFPDLNQEHEMMYTLALLHLKAGKDVDALQLFDKCYNLRRDLGFAIDFRDADIINHFGVLQQRLTGPAKALDFFARAEQILMNVAPESPLLATVRNNIMQVKEQIAAQPPIPAESSPVTSVTSEGNSEVSEDATSSQTKDWTWIIMSCLFAAYYSAGRGYSPVLWILLTLTTSVVVALSVLAILPNRKLQKLRARESGKLDQLLATRKVRTVAAVGGAMVLDVSVGDQATSA
jgi:tetratricopeptide (TPR) repeat protein